MGQFRRALLGVLPLLSVVAAGCGTATTAPMVSGAEARVSAVEVMGVERKLDYDFDRYKKYFAPKVKPNKQHRQGLLPASADLRKDCPPVYDQGKLGSCTAFACTKGMRETLARQAGERVTPLSALFGYYETRSRMPLIGIIMKHIDSGGTITEAVGALKDKGAAPEELWPYDVAQFTKKPPKPAYEAAKEFKIHSSNQLTNLEDVKATLAKGHTVAFGFKVFESFTKIGAEGKMPVPGAAEKPMGGHAVLAVGYDDSKKALIVRNSWSEKWADNGYFYMPYEVAGNAAMADDFWTAD
jgi:C1A family cysteine protease